jgi:lysophospholipase
MGHVRDFQDYVSDLRKFYTDFVRPTAHKKHVLLGHSMGGCIASLYLEKHNQDFDAAVLSSPMHEPRLGFLPTGIVDAMLDLEAWTGREEEYAPYQHGYDEKEKFLLLSSADPVFYGSGLPKRRARLREKMPLT